MITLVVVGLVSGIITAISPCVLPVLPAILTSSIQDGASSRRRPIVVVGGLVTSFAFFTLLGGIIVGSLGLPEDVLRWTGIVVLALVGLGLAIPALGHVLERPFLNTKIPTLNRDGNGFVMGLALGLVFVPCAGPILAAITVLAATNGLSWGLVALTLAFSVGIAVPLLIFGLAGQSIGSRIKVVRERLQAIRLASGVVLLVTALALSTNILEPLQRAVPTWIAAVQERIENNDAVRDELDDLAGREDQVAIGQYTFDECSSLPADELHDCGPARDIVGIDEWINTANGEPLTAADLEGKVVLVDFWTYSCINCQRTFPYITGWQERYADDGLVIVGIHSPEFVFEEDYGNVLDATRRYGIDYAVGLDNDFETWREWDQRFWPAHYLIDQTGTVRQVHYGEGEYAATEKLIQELLDAPPLDPVEAEPVGHTAGRTPELYLGYARLSAADNVPSLTEDPVTYEANENPAPNKFSFGGTWTLDTEYALAGDDAELYLNFFAKDVHLVLGGEGTVRVTLADDPSYERIVEVSGTPDLHDLYVGEAREDVMRLEFSEGVEAYAVTFG